MNTTQKASIKLSGNTILALILGLVGFLLYINTIGNDYVLDDHYAVERNQFVQQGISGIPKLMTIDFWYFTNVNLGYYRPLSLITFAIENEFFGNNAHISHFDNALLYGFSGFMLCLFLLQLFPKKHPMWAFLISLVFMTHPIHTEVVANIKSRDEILSFLNMILMLYFAFRFRETKVMKHLIWSLVFFYLALISKETAFVGIIFLFVFLFYAGEKVLQTLIKLLPYLGIWLLFFVQKTYFLGIHPTIPADLMSYPYRSHVVSLPSVFHIFSLCLQHMVWPWPMSFDYSYNQIPASHWSDSNAWIGLILFLGLAGLAIKGFMQKTIWGLGLTIIFIALLPSLGFVYLRGGIMAERFLYAACLGFAVLVVYGLSLIIKPKEDINEKWLFWLKQNPIFAVGTILICLVFSQATIARNMEWKDEITLFGTDAGHVPNSCQVHRLYATALLEKGRYEKDSLLRRKDFDLGISEIHKSMTIIPDLGDGYYRIGFAWQFVEVNLDSAIKYYKKCLEVSPENAACYNDLGAINFVLGRLPLASYYFNKAVEQNPQLGEPKKNAAYLKDSAHVDVHVLTPDLIKMDNEPIPKAGAIPVKPGAVSNPTQKEFMEAKAKGGELVQKADYTGAIKYFKKAAELQPDNTQNLIYLANSYGMAKKYNEAIKTFEKILEKDPENQVVIKNLIQTYEFTGQKDKAAKLKNKLHS